MTRRECPLPGRAAQCLAGCVLIALLSGGSVAAQDAHKSPASKTPDALGVNAVGYPDQTPDAAPDSRTINDRAGHNFYSINIMWVLLAGFLVVAMHAGFALVETGLCRAKNAAHTMGMNFMIYPLASIGFWVYGFALAFGNAHSPVCRNWYQNLGPGIEVLDGSAGGVMGTKGFFLSGCDDVSVMTLFFFMLAVFNIAATIPTGAMAERWSWKNFCLYGLWIALPFSLVAHWVWGGGWLAQLKFGHGAVDFAGSGVVHALGGIIGLAGAICLGPRVGKYSNGRPYPLPGHHVPMVVVGTFVLAFGWFGFNTGATLAGTNLRIATVAVNTVLASSGGAIAAMFTLYSKNIRPDPTIACNGMLAGLVAISGSCPFVDSGAAVAIGAIAGVLVVLSVLYWETRGIDDPVGAISVHGISGLWGVLAVGLFANGKYGAGWNGNPDGVKGLFYGDSSQFVAQLIEFGTVLVFGFAMAYAWFKISNSLTPLRASRDAEMQGLDIPELGAKGYPDFVIHD